MKKTATDAQLEILELLLLSNTLAADDGGHSEQQEALRAVLNELAWRRIGQDCLRSTIKSMRKKADE